MRFNFEQTERFLSSISDPKTEHLHKRAQAEANAFGAKTKIVQDIPAERANGRRCQIKVTVTYFPEEG